jgi:hypothetical protein
LDVVMSELDVSRHLDEFRKHDTGWLLAELERARAELRRHHTELRAIDQVLDERRAVEDDPAAEGRP